MYRSAKRIIKQELELMKKGQCIKCNGRSVYSDRNHLKQRISIGLWKYADVEQYICEECGYIENYIAKPKTLASYIKKRWMKVRR